MRVYILDKGGKGLEKIMFWLWENTTVMEVSLLKDSDLFLELIEREPPDIVLIRLGAAEIQGLKVGRTVKKVDSNIKIVFIADKKDYAIDAYEIGAFGYLLCPIERKKFDGLLNFKQR